MVTFHGVTRGQGLLFGLNSLTKTQHVMQRNALKLARCQVQYRIRFIYNVRTSDSVINNFCITKAQIIATGIC